MGDSYRPSDHYRSSESYRPTYGGREGPPGSSSYRPPLPSGPPPPLPPSPRGPPPPMHQFGRDIERDNGFAFRANGAPHYPENTQSYNDQQYQGAQRRRGRPDGRGGRGGRGRYQNRQGYVPRPKFRASERALLTFQRGSTPEQLSGMNNDVDEKTYIDLDDLSDSSEAPMEESDADEEVVEPQVVAPNLNTAKDDENRAVNVPVVSANPTPKWSNPEVYTSLPPVEETSDRKKKDMVKLIRKARVTIDKDAKKATQAAENADFISLDFDDGQAEDQLMDQAFANQNGAPVGAPSQPRNFDPAHFGSSILASTRHSTDDAEPVPNIPSLAQSVPTSNGSTPIDFKDSVAGQLGQLSTSRKRKRDHADDHLLKEPVHKKGRGDLPTGAVLPQWADVTDEALPWLLKDHRPTKNPGFRLHKEICDFYEFVRPRHYEHKIRLELLERLQEVLSKNFADVTVYSFGSFAAGIYLPNADMDVVAISDRYARTGRPSIGQGYHAMNALHNCLLKGQLTKPNTVEIIAKAKVPLIKYVDSLTGIKVDLSFENNTGVIANDTFQIWKSQFPALPILATVIKQFVMMRGLNEVSSGGLGGFSITCLIVSLLQNMPRVQMQEFAPEHHLGEMLLEFLDLYGNRFDRTRAAIRMSPPGYIDKRFVNTAKRPKIDNLCIVDPNNSANDISGGTREIGLIFERFSTAREQILIAMDNGRFSLLDWVLGGNYNDFLWHRRELRKIYESQYGSTQSDEELDVNTIEEIVQNRNDETADTSHQEAESYTQDRSEPEGPRMKQTNRSHDRNVEDLGSQSDASLTRSADLVKQFQSQHPQAFAWHELPSGIRQQGISRTLALWYLSDNGNLSYDEVNRTWQDPLGLTFSKPKRAKAKGTKDKPSKNVTSQNNKRRATMFQEMFPDHKSTIKAITFPNLLNKVLKMEKKPQGRHNGVGKAKADGKSQDEPIMID